MTLRQYLSTILDNIKSAIQNIHIEMSTENYTGTSITFNSKVADVPLDNFCIDVQGVQSGTGIPTPSNVRPISLYDHVDIDDNGNIINENLTNSFFRGKLYPNLGVFVADRIGIIIDGSQAVNIASQNYIKSDACDGYIILSSFIVLPNTSPASQPDDLICSHFKLSKQSIWSTVGYPNTFTINSVQVHLNIANDVLGITDYTQETQASAKIKITNWLRNNPVTVTYPTKQIINLTPTQIKTIIGNNSFNANGLNMTLKLARPKLKSNI